MSNTNDSETTKDLLEKRNEAATDSRSLDEIEEEEKTSNAGDSEVPSPDAPARDREANTNAGKDAGDPM